MKYIFYLQEFFYILCQFRFVTCHESGPYWKTKRFGVSRILGMFLLKMAVLLLKMAVLLPKTAVLLLKIV